MMQIFLAIWALSLALGDTPAIDMDAPVKDPSAEQEILHLVNQERTSRGLKSLALDERLSEASREHSSVMAAHREIGHQLDGEKNVELRIGGTGIHFSRSGENVAVSDTPEAVHQALMTSPGHRANILSPDFDSIGIGAVRDGYSLYVTQDFALRAPELTVDEAEDTVTRLFNELRASSGARPLPVQKPDSLRQGSCEMARENSVDARLFGGSGKFVVPNAQNIVAYTAVDVSKLPSDLTKLRTTPGASISIGACYAKSASYPNPVYWVAIVIRARPIVRTD